MANPIHQLQKVGEAKLEFLFWDIYRSKLYSPSGNYQQNSYPVALDIEYLRDIKAVDLVERTADEWQKLGFEPAQVQQWLVLLSDMWPNIKKHDSLLLLIDEHQKSNFYYNEQLIGSLEDPLFGPSFLSIWLDENCSYPELRKQLIGG